MGKDFIYIKQNGFNLKDVYNRLFSGCYEILEASDEKFFKRIPAFLEIEEIELGSAGTKESILRLKAGGFVVINKTLQISPLFEVFA